MVENHWRQSSSASKKTCFALFLAASLFGQDFSWKASCLRTWSSAQEELNLEISLTTGLNKLQKKINDYHIIPLLFNNLWSKFKNDLK